jgi:FdhE protein
VAYTPWQKRIRRAEQLAGQNPFAAELLRFYMRVATFQEGIYERLDHNKIRAATSPVDPTESPELLASFPNFLTLITEIAPAHLAEIAHEILNSSFDSQLDLLSQFWSKVDVPPEAPEEFLAYAFLQPYAEFVRAQAGLQLDGSTHPLCPFCNRKAAIAVLRPQGDGARRNLVCGFCLCEWEFRRVVCAGCGQEDQAKLPVYTAEQFPHMRVECCDSCHTYIKSVDLSKNGLADALVDELAAVPLDLWAREHEYVKLFPNLLGL